MPELILSTADVLARMNSVHQALAVLRAPTSSRVAVSRAPVATRDVVLAAHDGKLPSDHYRQWRFRTRTSGVFGAYFESWHPKANGQLQLRQAYFKLVRVDGPNLAEEMLAVHSDPADSTAVKQVPHLHMSLAPDPIPHCHFSMQVAERVRVLESSSSLTNAMQLAIKNIADEVLQRL